MPANDKVIDVPGMGTVAFPGSMSDDDISAQIKKHLAIKASNPTPDLAPGNGAPPVPKANAITTDQLRESNPAYNSNSPFIPPPLDQGVALGRKEKLKQLMNNESATDLSATATLPLTALGSGLVSKVASPVARTALSTLVGGALPEATRQAYNAISDKPTPYSPIETIAGAGTGLAASAIPALISSKQNLNQLKSNVEQKSDSLFGLNDALIKNTATKDKLMRDAARAIADNKIRLDEITRTVKDLSSVPQDAPTLTKLGKLREEANNLRVQNLLLQSKSYSVPQGKGFEATAQNIKTNDLTRNATQKEISDLQRAIANHPMTKAGKVASKVGDIGLRGLEYGTIYEILSHVLK